MLKNRSGAVLATAATSHFPMSVEASWRFSILVGVIKVAHQLAVIEDVVNEATDGVSSLLPRWSDESARP